MRADINWRQTSSHPMATVGHRGDCARQPENTLPAFVAAWREGAPAIELDARRGRDGVLVISHDPTVDRCTDGTGAILDLTFAQLKQLNAAAHFPGASPTPIPALAEVLDWAKGKVQVNIHINNNEHDYPGIERQIVDLVRTKGMVHSVMLSSFDAPTINQLKRDNPDIPMGLLFDVHPSLGAVRKYAEAGALVGAAAGAATLNPLLALGGMVVGAVTGFVLGRKPGDAVSLAGWKDTPVDVLCPFWANVEKHWVRAAHQAGKTVYPYTVNSPLNRAVLRWAGCDGVISDNPGRTAL